MTDVQNDQYATFDHNTASLDELYAVYDSLHGARCPVMHSDEQGGFYVVAGHSAVKAAATDWQTFSSTNGFTVPKVPGRPAAISYDPPEHKFWRDLYREVINLSTFRGFADRITEHVNELIDQFAPRGHADLVSEIANVVPISTVMEIVGIRDVECIASARQFGNDLGSTGHNPQRTFAALGGLAGLCMEQVNARRSDPRDDYLTRLALQDVEGRMLTDDEIANVLVGLFMAGHHTTASTLSSLLDRIARDTHLRDQLAADPALIPKAAEEAIRLYTPLHGFFRQATADVDFEGHEIPATSEVMLNYAAANLDPTVFDCPHDFRVDRSPNPHVGFGYGIHTCVGAQLARLELKIVVGEVLRRLPDLSHTGEDAEWIWSDGNLMALTRVPVIFTAADTL